MTPSTAILVGSGIIAVSIVAAALVLPEGGMIASQKAKPATDVNQQATAPRFQIIKTEQGRTWRLDTQTGKITVCHLRNDRMICADSTTATQLPQATPEQLEKQEQERRHAKREDRNEMLDRFMNFFERIIKFAQKHAEPEKAPAPEDDAYKNL